MSAITGYLLRLNQNEGQTLGRFFLFEDTDPIFEACSAELAWRDNQRCISCIPAGTYKCVRRYSEKYDEHWILEDVPGRSLILIHHGNYAGGGNACDTKGCILLGSPRGFHDINSDGVREVVSSRRTMHRLNATLAEHCVESFHLRVV